MSKLKNFFVSAVVYLCALAIGLMIWLFTFQTTILNRAVVKNWVAQSSIYSKLVPTLIKAYPTTSASSLMTPEMTKEVIISTFTPAYVKKQVEKAIDAYYNWLEDKTKTIEYSLSLDSKQADLQKQFTTSIGGELAGLPVCTAQLVATNQLCRPAGASTESLASSLAEQAVNDSGLLDQKFTTKDIVTDKNMGATANVTVQDHLPTLRRWIGGLFMALPVFIILCLGLIAWLASGYRLLAFRRLARRAFFGALFSAIAAGVIIFFSDKLSIAASIARPGNSDIIGLFLPVIENAIDSIAWRLLQVAGGAAIFFGIAWLVLYFINKHKNKIINTMQKPKLPKASQKTNF